ncbi:hypothetical protein CORC01_06151 [Colletotrichum orchidophilum]|uniref:NYN domain-containing protein n=1 Tax=Colletotrichum orchidophilum TaxID=1209926 RepID=A0A1G4BAV3_9PEZI|nr:uncharacterized protein CORC01_06151 [Colletotrichum orchidophilum]OHE98530.1 hypothetical protein CORC01_06151 [Colletotrichum orchidophilum]
MARSNKRYQKFLIDEAEAKRLKVESGDKKPAQAASSEDSGYHTDSSRNSGSSADLDCAGERLFGKQTANRPLPSSQLPFSARTQQRFGAHDEKQQLAYPEQSSRGLWIYADGSNISVSYYNALKKLLGMRKDHPLPSVFSFSVFRGILERGREVNEGVVVGSRTGASQHRPSSTPKYLQEAEACDYTAKVLQRVRANEGSSFAGSSDANGKIAMKEQGVDETVQHHMRKTILDNLGTPGVMILATGDGNLDGDMPGGFPAAVQSALANGWVVEVYHFAESAHSIWRDSTFLHNPEWDGRLTCHALDDFLHDMDARKQGITPSSEAPRSQKRGRRESKPSMPCWTSQKAACVAPPPPAIVSHPAPTLRPSPPPEVASTKAEETKAAEVAASLSQQLKPEMLTALSRALIKSVASQNQALPSDVSTPPAAVGAFAAGPMGYFGAQAPSPPTLTPAFTPAYPLQYPQASSYSASLGKYSYNTVWGNQPSNYNGYSR